MYLNNVGVRKTAMFIGCSRTTITNWVKKAKTKLDEKLKKFEPNYSKKLILLSWTKNIYICKKNKKEQSYGLLILDSKNVLLHIT